MNVNKVILVIDKPIGCIKCPLLDFGLSCVISGNTFSRDEFINSDDEFILEGCPLKPMPKKKEIVGTKYIADSNQYALAWNACIDEILGEENEHSKS